MKGERKNDRGFRIGDTLLLREWDQHDGYSGRWLTVEVTYVLGQDVLSEDALRWGYVVMGFKPGIAGARFEDR